MVQLSSSILLDFEVDNIYDFPVKRNDKISLIEDETD